MGMQLTRWQSTAGLAAKGASAEKTRKSKLCAREDAERDCDGCDSKWEEVERKLKRPSRRGRKFQ
jgi:hypothetical protein